MAERAPRSPASKVKFSDGGIEKPMAKLVPTQKYNRKEIQKRLEIETWMDVQLTRLFQSEEYPQLDIDDVHKIDIDERENKIRAYLSGAKKPINDFVKELLSKAREVNELSSS